MSSLAQSQPRDELETAIRTAWRASLPATPFDLDRSWSDIGLDSLKALEFILRLERLLDTKVDYEALAPESTAGDLLAQLTRAAAATRETPQVAPQVFLLPGIFGDEPKLAAFRRAMRPDVVCEILPLPDIESPARVLGDIPATAATLVEVVNQRQPNGEVHLAGYSFGGLVAQELARQMTAAGRPPASLTILDGLLDFKSIKSPDRMAPDAASPSATPKTSWRERGDRAAFSLLMRVGWWELARQLLVAVGPRHDWSWSSMRRRWLIGQVRGWALLRWAPKVCEIKTLLVSSNDPSARSSQARWRAICPNHACQQIRSTHLGLFEPDCLPILRPALLQILQSSALETARQHG